MTNFVCFIDDLCSQEIKPKTPGKPDKPDDTKPTTSEEEAKPEAVPEGIILLLIPPGQI